MLELISPGTHRSGMIPCSRTACISKSPSLDMPVMNSFLLTCAVLVCKEGCKEPFRRHLHRVRRRIVPRSFSPSKDARVSTEWQVFVATIACGNTLKTMSMRLRQARHRHLLPQRLALPLESPSVESASVTGGLLAHVATRKRPLRVILSGCTVATNPSNAT